MAPEDVPRRWRFARESDRGALMPLEEAMALAIANEPDEAGPYLARARFREQTYDFAGALADLSAAIEIEATADLLEQRARIHKLLRDWSSAQVDLEEAYFLDPSPFRAIALAEVLATLGQVENAVEMLALEDGDEETQQSLAISIADLEARQGHTQAGLDRITEELADDPNNPMLLNSKCWFIGTWNVQLSEGTEACRQAVERGENPAQVLDSRAMFWLREGELEKARADIEEAIRLAPWQTASLLLRGLIKREQGDETAELDIENAIARRPDLADTYAQWGFVL